MDDQKRHRRHSWVACAVVAACGLAAVPAFGQGLPTAAPAELGLKPAVLDEIDAAMRRFVDQEDVAGIVILIARHGKVGHLEAFGMRDREAAAPMPTDAIFRLQSMTKPVVAATAMALYDEGKLELDEPISRLLPEWGDVQVAEEAADGTVNLVPAKSPITARQLMSHSSGLYYAGGAPKGVDLRSLPSASPVSSRQSLAEFSKALASAPLAFQPGTSYRYGHSIDVLGRLIEAVTGKPLDEVMKEMILQPLAMTDTDFWAPPAKIRRLAQLYTQPAPGKLARGRGPETVAAKPSLFLGGQGLLSTAADYARFAQMLLARGELDGVRVLRRETAEMMYQNHLPPEAGRSYGLGGAVDLEGGYTWGGANGTQFWIDTANDMFVVFMVQTQRYHSGAYPEFNRLVSGLLEDPVGEVGLGVNRSGLGQLEAPRRGPAPGGLFERLDANGDGKLSRDESPDPALFDRLDADHDGFVTRAELAALGAR